MKRDMDAYRIGMYLVLAFGLSAVCTAPLFILKPKDNSLTVMAVSIVFMFLPMVSALTVRCITKDRSDLYLHLSLKQSWKQYLMAAFLPGLITVTGAALYFLLFPDQFDLSMGYLRSMMEANGQMMEIPTVTMPMIAAVCAIAIAAAPLVLINHVLAFGEELGWRGYLLPILCKKFSPTKAILLDGVLWGLIHAPLVCFGVNYTGSYPGRPWSGILMMAVFATSLGIFCSYLTLQTKSIFPACIAHGAINAVRELPLFFCVPGCNALLGPKPSGIVGMAGLMILDLFLMYRLLNQDAPSAAYPNS